MSLINIGAGLSAAGGAVAQFAGNLAIEDQKAQLEMQKGFSAEVADIWTGEIAAAAGVVECDIAHAGGHQIGAA